MFKGKSVCGRKEIDLLFYIRKAGKLMWLAAWCTLMASCMGKQMGCLLALLKVFFLRVTQVETCPFYGKLLDTCRPPSEGISYLVWLLLVLERISGESWAVSFICASQPLPTCQHLLSVLNVAFVFFLMHNICMQCFLWRCQNSHIVNI